MTPDRIEREILIHAPIEVVWAVVTEPEQIVGWFSDSIELDPTPGGRAVFQWNEHGNVYHGRIERLEPPHRMSFRWAVDPDTEPAADNSTLVEFSLSAERNSTRLTVVETGFQDLGGPDEDKQRHFDGHSRGWERELGELVAYLRQQTDTPAGR